MTIHTIDKRMALLEVPVAYRDRPAGSFSKLNTIRDGVKVLRTIYNLFRFYRPLFFFSAIGCVLSIISVVLFMPILAEYLRSGMVPRYPTLIGCGFILLSALLSFTCGLILESMKKQSDQFFELLSVEK